MAPGINGYNDAFRHFVDFAQQRIDAGDDKSVIVATSADGSLASRKIASVSTSATDKEGFFHTFVRSADDKQANLNTRALFRAAIEDMFQGKGGIPASVENALNQIGSGHGRPLTARTIIAVQHAIDQTGILATVSSPGDGTSSVAESSGNGKSGSSGSVSEHMAVQEGISGHGPEILDDASTQPAPSAGASSKTSSAGAPPPARTTINRLMSKLGIFMSRVGQKTIESVDADQLKKTLRFSSVPRDQRKILDTFARQASAALAELDKLKPSEIGAAYRALLGQQPPEDGSAPSVYKAVAVFKNALDSQANLSESLRIVMRNTDLKESRYDALSEMRLVCDRRLSEINALGAELSKMSAEEVEEAAGGRSIVQMLGSITIGMHGNAEMYDELGGGDGQPSATARLAEKLESFKNRTTALTEGEYKELASTIHDAKADFESLERKVTEGTAKNIDKSLLIGARCALDEILSDLDSTGKLAFEAVNDYADRAFLIGDATLFGGKALGIYRDSGKLPNIVNLMQLGQTACNMAKAVLANPGDANARQAFRTAYDSFTSNMGSSDVIEAVKRELGFLSRNYESILDGASEKSKSALSDSERSALRSALAGLDANTRENIVAKMSKISGYPGAVMDHLIDAANRAGRLGGGGHTGEAVRAIVEGRTPIGTMVELFAHGLGPGDIPPQGIDDAHFVSREFLGEGGLNSVYKVSYRSETDEVRTFVFKSELAAREALTDAHSIGKEYYSTTQQTITLNLATQDTADALGIGNITVRTFGGKCDGEYGTFMEFAPGQSAKAFSSGKAGSDAFGKEALNTLTGQVRSGDPAATAKARNLVATFAQSANRLEWLDLITGQVDRHGENYFVHIDSQTGKAQLKAIDNDLGFANYRTGLLKFELNSMHGGRFTGVLRSIRTRFYPGVSEADFNATFHLDHDHGVDVHPDGTVTVDFGKLGSQLPLASLSNLFIHSAPIPDEIDQDVFDHLIALDKQADGQPTQARAAYLDRLATRMDKASFDAAVSRLDEAIALAKKLNADNKVRPQGYWESDVAIARVGQPRPELDVRSVFPKIGDVEPDLEQLRKDNPAFANQMEGILTDISKVDHYLRRDFPDVCDLAAALSGSQHA